MFAKSKNKSYICPVEFSSIIPTEMTLRELDYMIQILKQSNKKGDKVAVIRLKNGLSYNQPVERLKDYKQQFKLNVVKFYLLTPIYYF